MSSPNMNGRKGQSLDELRKEIHELFQNHSEAKLNDDGEHCIPGEALVNILQTISASHAAGGIMSDDEMVLLERLVVENPGVNVTEQLLLQFIAQRTNGSTESSPSPETHHDIHIGRGRPGEKTEYVYDSRSRSSSRGSVGTSVYRPQSRPPSRGPPVPPKTPTSRDSPFDVSARQRTTPLVVAPSSWTRRPPPSRRKSDAGSHSRASSDSESSMSPPPVSYSRSHGTIGRARAPSNPTTPDPYLTRNTGAFSPISIGSPPFSATHSRPHSRAQSQPQSQFPSFGMLADRNYGSPERDDYDYDGPYDSRTGMMSPPPSDMSEVSYDNDDLDVSGLPTTRRGSDSGSDSDDDDDEEMGLIHERTATMSTVSLEQQERLEALQKHNEALRKKLKDLEDTLQRKISEQELDMESIQAKMDELKSELSTVKRSEKELRANERTHTAQITSLEASIAAVSKNLDNSRQAYNTLNTQYQEQCDESQRYRDLLTQREEEFRLLKENNSLQTLELKKWEDEQVHWHNQMKALENELAAAQLTQAALDEQKQENLMLKETIDRMRFEIQDMRTAASNSNAPSGLASAKSSISRSLGAELAGKMKDTMWDIDEPAEVEREEDAEAAEDEDTEGEDIIQTIITRTKRKVTNRSRRLETQLYEETKDYSDTGVQHDLSTGTFAAQTEPESRPVAISYSVQTDERPTTTMEIQTDPEPIPAPPALAEMEIQTDDFEPEETSASAHTEEDNETLASSSSTLIPPTPKAHTEHDLPPAYNQVTGHDHDELAIRVANETLKKWHKGLKLPIEPVPGGISEDAVEDWKALKEELGIECGAIDRLVAESARTGLPRSSKDASHARGSRRRSGFYNIYNTYVYGGGDKDGGSAGLGHVLFCVGASAAVAYLVGQAMSPQYAIPGAATYYDRAAWSGFNSIQVVGEGFPGDGSSAAFWGFLGRLSGGAARTLRGWPT